MQSSDMRVEFKEGGGAELRWCVFTKQLRGSIAKIVVNVSKFNPTKTAHVVSVYVNPEFRGKRLGEQLVEIAKTNLRANGFHYLTLEAEENTTTQYGRLVALYQRCGFEIHPPGLKDFKIEYNDDEVYRKVPMRCNLYVTEEETTTTTTTTTTGAAMYDNLEFCLAMKRECIRLMQSGEHAMGVLQALEWVRQSDANSTQFSFRLANMIKEKGHPDWMELAAYLIDLGRVQLRYEQWHAPFVLSNNNTSFTPPPLLRCASSCSTVDTMEEEDGDCCEEGRAKCGALPSDASSTHPKVLDTEAYSHHQGGLDESTLSWSEQEYLFVMLSHQPPTVDTVVPMEMAQVLRYYRLSSWLDTNELQHLESNMDLELKEMTLAFRDSVQELACQNNGMLLSAWDMESSEFRCKQLLEKYLPEVRVM